MLVPLYVRPASSKDYVRGMYNDRLLVYVKAPAVDGSANLAVVKVLAKELNIPKGNLTVLSGHTSKRKRVEILGDEKDIAERISQLRIRD